MKKSRREFLKTTSILTIAAGTCGTFANKALSEILNSKSQLSRDGLPNILWLVSEDNSPFLGCYGDKFATSPNIDKLASEGFLYTHCYANAPVCAPARNSIITGVYANSNGHEHMRSNYKKSDIVKTYPEFLREAGYYCTNNDKTDYNTSSIDPSEIWDESSNKAHYKNRAPGQPFFAIFNTMISHESSLHTSTPEDRLRHNPEEVILPPYHPSTKDIKNDWAQYYDKIEEMDTWVGEKLQELEDTGLAENTIVFYYGDNGGVLPFSKRFVYERGTHVPLILRIPEKYKYLYPAEKPGTKVDRLISFVDLAPTLLSIVGLQIPGYMQGDAFLGEQKTKKPKYVFMFRGRMDERYDMSRSVRDDRFRYIHNYMPYRIYGQHLNYLWLMPATRSWEKAYRDGKCNETQSVFWNTKPVEELYDTENDPWEVNNLANDPLYREKLEELRAENLKWTHEHYDAGFIPEADLVNRVGENPIYDYVRSNEVDLKSIIDAAEIASFGKIEDMKTLQLFLNSKESAIRYWGATGLLVLGEEALPAKADLLKALNDSSANVVVVAAEAVYKLNEKEDARKALLNVLVNSNMFARCHALNTIDCINDSSSKIIMGVVNLIKRQPTKLQAFDMQMALYLIKKWALNTVDYGIGWFK